MSTSPASAGPWMSSRSQYSSRPSPRRPRTRSLRPPSRNTRPNAVIRARANTAEPSSPPAQNAVAQATPSATENAGKNHFVLYTGTVVIEDLLHRLAEVARERQRERQRGGVPALLDRVGRLSGHLHRLGQLSLRQAPLGAQRANLVLHLL